MQYLSEAWFQAADEAVRAAGASPSGPVTIDQHIDDGPRWRIQLGETSQISQLDAADAVDCADTVASADATFSQSHGTAVAIARGQADAHQAFLLGDVRFEGSIDVLIEHRDALDWLQQALAPVMAATDWDEISS